MGHGRVRTRAALAGMGVCALFAAWSERAAAESVVHAVRVPAGAIIIDGHGTEAAWATAPARANFLQSYPVDQGAPSEETAVRVLYDDDALYFLLEARDSKPKQIRGLLTQRDLDSPSDWLDIWLNPQNDGQTGYRFSVNARGVQQDARVSKGGEVQDVNWNAVWASAVTRGEHGWVAELRVPYSELRYDASARHWGMQVVRRLARQNETSTLAPLPKAAARPLYHVATLEGLPTRASTSGIAMRPYGLMAVTRESATTRPTWRLGTDVRWNVSAATTLEATLLPDFGQVEQDPSQLNLTAYEISQSERRQFFLDGAENLTLELGYLNPFAEQLYYSRRIGARPTRVLDEAQADLLQYPQQRTILGASKLLGRTDRGLSFSWLNAITAAEDALYTSAAGTTREPVAASATYNIARVRQEVQRGRGQVGVAGTWVHRFVDGPLSAYEVADALTGAADWDLRWGNIGLKGQLVGSRLTGSAAAIDTVQRSSTNNLQRPGASYAGYAPEAEQLSGYGLALQGGKYDGSPLRAYWGGWLRSPGLNTNDLGFLRYADQLKGEAGLTYRLDQPSALHQFGEITGGGWVEKTWGGELTSAGAGGQVTFNLANNWWIWLGGDRRKEALDPRLLRGGEAFLVPGVSGFWAGFDTDQRRVWRLKVSGSGQRGDEDSTRVARVDVEVHVRPSASWLFAMLPSAEWKNSRLQYVATEGEGAAQTSYLGDLHTQTLALTLRVSWAIALGLTLDIYASPFVSAGRYHAFYAVTDARASDYTERTEERAYDAASGFHFSQLRSNSVLRWDYAPGASFYAVWTHGQQTSSALAATAAPLADFSRLVEAPASDTLLFKLGYFFGG